MGTDRWATDDRSPPSLAVGYGNAGLDHGWTTGVRSPHTVDSTDNSFPALSPARTPSPTYFGSDEHRQAEEQRLLHQSIQQGTSTLDPQTLTRQTGWPTKKKKQPKKKVRLCPSKWPGADAGRRSERTLESTASRACRRKRLPKSSEGSSQFTR